MARLDRAANDVARLAKKMAVEKIKKEKAKPKMWKDKIILPLKEWRKKQDWNTHEWRNYYPDRYVPNLLIYPGDNETIREYQEEWWSGFCEYMESVKEPGFAGDVAEIARGILEGRRFTSRQRGPMYKENIIEVWREEARDPMQNSEEFRNTH